MDNEFRVHGFFTRRGFLNSRFVSDGETSKMYVEHRTLQNSQKVESSLDKIIYGRH